MVILHEVGFIDALPGVEEVDHRGGHASAIFVGDLLRQIEPGKAAPAEHVKHQHAVVRDHRPAALADDDRVIDLGLVADFLDVEDHVVGVFLKAVVDRRAEVGLGAVVIDPQAAADIDVL